MAIGGKKKCCSQHLATCIAANLEDVTVPFVTSQRLHLQNCVLEQVFVTNGLLSLLVSSKVK